ncbi:MAG: class I SAM-dependent methyltransferase [Elusimicrobiales bacterium]|nr:class I SAM-dependent methyltransferase [Elusimicrobiales bacterium]
MSLPDRDQDKELKTSFNSVADLYDTHRPGYPAEMIEETIRFSGIPQSGSILEIGCGTGQATKPFAERGYALTCLDPGPDTAAKARQKFSQCPAVTVITATFEDWLPPQGQYYDLVIAATSFHWVAPCVRFTKSAQVLRPGGTLALLYNSHVSKDSGFFLDAQAIYDRIVPGLRAKKTKPSEPAPAEAGMELFEKPVLKHYEWEKQFSAKDYVSHLATFSDHISLPEAQREDLFRELAALINGKYDGKVSKSYKSELVLYAKPSQLKASLPK